MRMYLTNEQRMMAHYQDQLNQLGFTDLDHLTYGELKHKLTIERMRNINYESESNKYF